MKLLWKRTVIGGETAPHDFAAYCELGNVGRIYRNKFGPSAGTWFWGYHAGGGNPIGGLCYGVAETKSEAVENVQRFYDAACEKGILLMYDAHRSTS